MARRYKLDKVWKDLANMPAASPAPMRGAVDTLNAVERVSEPLTAICAMLRPRTARPGRARPLLALLLLTASGALSVGLLAWEEANQSRVQAALFGQIASEVRYEVAPGRAEAMRYPEHGPLNERRGYTRLPAMIRQLETEEGMVVTAQARQSARLIALHDHGLYPPYDEKAQAGLTLLDKDGLPLYTQRYPRMVFDSLDEVPDVVVDSLLFLENRELLRPVGASQSPVVEWDRLAYALAMWVLDKVGIERDVPGGSTLATQLEKFQHSPRGLTIDAKEKLAQLVSASLRVYKDGPDTRAAREKIVLDYINGVPLSSVAGWGEVYGISDGLWAWYGEDVAQVMDALRHPERDMAYAGRAYRMVLSLFLAQRSPSRLLRGDPQGLQRRTTEVIGWLEAHGTITPALADAARRAQVTSLREAPAPVRPSFVESKGVDAMRGHLRRILGVSDMYALDRLDLTAQTTLDQRAQREVRSFLLSLSDPEEVKRRKLYGEQLFEQDDPLKEVIYSFTLYERREHENLLRVQVDTQDKPMNLNEGAKLDLGSTAKLRTLVTYLEAIAGMHSAWAGLSRAQLRALELEPGDRLAEWTRTQLVRSPGMSLDALLEAAMRRRYSASPYEHFFTGGGRHVFHNFRPEDNGRVMSVEDALRRSVNLVFVRMMEDLVRHYRYDEVDPTILEDIYHPDRTSYLKRFIQKEGREYLKRFYNRYAGLSADKIWTKLVHGRRMGPLALAVVYRSVEPVGTLEQFIALAQAELGPETEDGRDVARLAKLYAEHPVERFSLRDRAYLAGLHPLELWVASELMAGPQPSYELLAAQGEAGRFEEVYDWLIKRPRTRMQNTRIRIMLEEDAFARILDQWWRVGYPFEEVMPSLATALGASGDRPAALAELMGIVSAGGVRYPTRRFERVWAAQHTPYEVALEGRGTREGEQVMTPEVAAVVKRALGVVVERGTASRAGRAWAGAAQVAGKTGTGDHRREVYERGRKVGEVPVSRTATFAFMLGERHYGVMTAYVEGEVSGEFVFTSALTTELVGQLRPVLEPMLGEAEAGGAVWTTSVSADGVGQ
jgi:membrane peptidoglycan carboxypeptidase